MQHPYSAGAKKAAAGVAEEVRAMIRRADNQSMSDRRVNPEALHAVGLKRAHDKAARLETVMAGREGREFGSSKVRRRCRLTPPSG